MEDKIDTTTDFTHHNDEELLLNEVIRDNADLFFIHCCLGELTSQREEMEV
ncbi:MAG: hypothetical protein SNG02_03160 [Rikenellaceae bacterium]